MANGAMELWEGAGPVDGDPSTANSKRPELAGYAASLEVLLMFKSLNPSFIEPDFTICTTTWIDSDAARKHLGKMLDPTFVPKRKFPNDPDLLVHIKWLWKELPMIQHTIRWVKAHQDTRQPVGALPLNAQLNIKADQLATDYYQAMKSNTTKMIARANPLRLPACPVFITVNGQDITAKYKESIRFHINGTSMRKHLQTTRLGWNDMVWESIEFIGLSGALLSTPILYQTKVSKSIHGCG
jgi:hypothetical protein